MVLTPVPVQLLPGLRSLEGSPGLEDARELTRGFGEEAPIAGLLVRHLQHPHGLASGFPRAADPKEIKVEAAVSLMA